MLRILPPLLLVVALCGCAATGPAPSMSETSSATSSTPVTHELEGLFADWDAGVTGSDEVGLFFVTIKLPGAVEAECYPSLDDSLQEYLSGAAVEASTEVDQVTADTGGARAIDIYKAWTGYVELARDSC